MTRPTGWSPAGAAGVGVDIVKVDAFAQQLAEEGTRFAEVFTPGERRAARRGGTDAREAESLAGRWAAKEAVLKAWSSTRYGRDDDVSTAPVRLREIEIRTDELGRPAVRLHGEAARHLHQYDVLVSMSHDPAADTAVAFVVLRAAS